MDVGKSVISTLKTVGEAEMINAEESEDCGVEVVYVHWVRGDIITKIIRFAIGGAGCDSPSGKPQGEAAGMMVPAVVLPG